MRQKKRRHVSLLAHIWADLPLLASGVCGGLALYIALWQAGPHDARLLLTLSCVVGFIIGLSGFGSVFAGESLLDENTQAEPLTFKEAGWLLGLPLGLLAGVLYILNQHPHITATFVQNYTRPLLLNSAFFAILWAALARLVARQAHLRLDDYACALFIDRHRYAPLAHRKKAWQLSRKPLQLDRETAEHWLPDIILALAQKLQSTRNAVESRHIVVLLGALDDTAVAPVLMEALDQPRRANRRAAIIALGHLRRTEATPRLIQIVRDDPDAQMRWSAVVALGVLHSADALSVLLSALADPDDRVRRSACVALAKLGDETALPTLEKCLSDCNRSVAGAARKAIAHLRGEE